MSKISIIEKDKKIGSGSYGSVYSANIITNDKSKKVALKRNFRDGSASWIGCLKEMDMLKTVSDHKCMVRLREVRYETDYGPSIFSNTNECLSPITDSSLTNDKAHFVFELINLNLSTYLHKNIKNIKIEHIKSIACQLLVGLEYIHFNDIAHRDLKPDNILVKMNDDIPEIKICDFGMSQRLSSSKDTTPGVTTSWYRAPEVCCGFRKYTNAIDIWSMGCIFYELITGVPLFMFNRDDEKDDYDSESVNMINTILNMLPQKPSQFILNKFTSMGNINLSKYSNNSGRKTLKERVSKSMSEKFSRDTLDQFIDLINHLLCFDPELRYTATQALEHPFFDSSTLYITNIRKEYPLVNRISDNINIFQCFEKKCVNHIVKTTYNSTIENIKSSWYDLRVIFHAIDTFHRYLNFINEDDDKRNQRFTEQKIIDNLQAATKNNYVIHKTFKEVYMVFCTILYIYHKYYSTLCPPLLWTEFILDVNNLMTDSVIPNLTDDDNLYCEQFEEKLIRDILDEKLFNISLYEVVEKYNIYRTHEDISNIMYQMLTIYINCKKWTDGNVYDFYIRHKES
jgi:serine/threonine protein kinase